MWEEHTGIIHPTFYQPSSMECVLQMRAIGQTNWEVRCGLPHVKCCARSSGTTDRLADLLAETVVALLYLLQQCPRQAPDALRILGLCT